MFKKILKITRKVLCCAVLLAFACYLVSLRGCTNDRVNVTGTPVLTAHGWNFIDGSGALLLADDIPADVATPGWEINGVFSLQDVNSGLYSVCRIMNRKVQLVASDLVGLHSVGIMNDGLIPLSRPAHPIEVYTNLGQYAFTLDSICGVAVTACDPQFVSDRLIVYAADGSVGVVDSRGRTIVGPGKYDEITAYSNDIAVASVNTEPCRVDILDKNGKVTQCIKDCVLLTQYHDGRTFLKNEEEDLTNELRPGQERRPMVAKVRDVLSFDEDYVVFYDDNMDERGVIDDLDATLLSSMDYSDIYLIGKQKFLCRSYETDRWMVVNADNQPLFELDDVEDIHFYSGRGTNTVTSSRCAFIDTNILFAAENSEGKLVYYDSNYRPVGTFEMCRISLPGKVTSGL